MPVIRVLNFDNSVVKQKGLFSRYENEVVDFTDLAPQARYWVDHKTRAAIARRLTQSPKNSITFLGSGDFHHISEILISQFDEPISLICFDFHPDWTKLPPRFGCGAWVNEVLKQKNILKVILLGVSSKDISSFEVQSGNLASLKDNRVELYPYAHSPSRTFLRRVPKNISIAVKKGICFNKVYWHELARRGLQDFMQELFRRIPARQVYVSIDKDCLKNEFAVTNWEEGKMFLEELLLMLKLIKENLDIVGLDIVGDYSDVCAGGLIKRIAAYFDHPKDIAAKHLEESAITAINEKTNLKILEEILPGK